MSPPFSVASAVRPVDAGRYAVELDSGWLQGRGAFGGLVAAWLVRSMEAELGRDGFLPAIQSQGAPPPLRVFGCELVAAARPGGLAVHVRLLRAGLNVVFVGAELRRHDRIVARATGTFGRDLPTVADRAHAGPPAVPPPSEVPPWAPPMSLPVYCQHVAHARCFGREVLSGPDAERALGGWTSFRVPTPDDAASRVALLDAWPPALFVHLAAARAVGTISMTCQLVGLPGPAVAPGTPLLVTARSAFTTAGYSDERGELWTPDGRLLGTSHQVVAVLADGSE